MFNKNQTANSAPTQSVTAPSRTSSNAPSILASDLIIKGDLKTDGDIQIDGRVEGNIKASGVTVGEQGFINGKIAAVKVLVRGKITGHISAKSVELADTANVQADIIQDELMIANGAFFDGKCSRKSAPITQGKAATETATSSKAKA